MGHITMFTSASYLYLFFSISWQISKLISEITKPRRNTCDTALESWKSILFDEKFFKPLQKFLVPFFAMTKQLDIFQKSKTFLFMVKTSSQIFELITLRFYRKTQYWRLKNEKAHPFIGWMRTQGVKLFFVWFHH